MSATDLVETGSSKKFPNTQASKDEPTRRAKPRPQSQFRLVISPGAWVFPGAFYFYFPTRNMISRINGSSWLGSATWMAGLNGSLMSLTMVPS